MKNTESKPRCKIKKVSIDRPLRRVLFHLDGDSAGMKKIAFDLNEGQDLKQMLHGLAAAGTPFSFTQSQDLGDQVCKIEAIEVFHD